MTAANAAGQLVFLPTMAALVTMAGWRLMSLALAAIVVAFVPVLLWRMRESPQDLGLAPYGDTRPAALREWVARALHRHGLATESVSRRRGDGFRLRDAYITAALHCVPPDNRPLPRELARCAPYLVEELRLLRRVRVVIALGRVAFDVYLRALATLGVALPRPRPAFAHGAAHVVTGPDGTPVTLLATYHPSRQNTQTGRLTWPMFEAVFARARSLLPP